MKLRKASHDFVNIYCTGKMKMRTSGSLDSKIPRLDFVSEEKSPN